MFERLTTKAREAVTASAEVARSAGATEIRPEHLFSAVLEDEDSLAVRVLADLGATAGTLRAELARRRESAAGGLDEDDAEALATIGIDLEEVLRHLEADTSPSRRRPRFGKGARKVMELSLREAIALRHNYIGTEHLLLGLARAADPVVTACLEASGVAPAELRPAVADAVRKAG